MSYAEYCRLGLHVGASNMAVIRAVRKTIAPVARNSREFRKRRHAYYRVILKIHKDAGDLFRRYRF